MVTFSITDIAKDESYIVSEPVTLDEAKLQAYANDYDDDKITSLITQSRQVVENYCNISIINKTITVTGFLENTPTTKYWNYANTKQDFLQLELPYGPVGNIVSITGATTFNPTTSNPLVLNQDYFIYGTLFKTIRVMNNFDELIMAYYAGYDSCPEQLKLAILAQLSFLFENRGDSVNRYAQQNVGISEVAQQLANAFIRQSWL